MDVAPPGIEGLSKVFTCPYVFPEEIDEVQREIEAVDILRLGSLSRT